MGVIFQGSSHDFKNQSTVKNIINALEAGDAVPLSQLQTLLGLKQDNLIPGNGMEVNGADINISLAVAGVGYDNLTLSGTSASSLDGSYTKLDYQAKLSSTGTNLDLVVGDDDVDWNGYYKDNGGGVWAVIFKRDSDTSQATNPEIGSWLAVLTTTDPTSMSYSGSGTMIVSSYIPNYQGVDHDIITSSSESSGDGNFSPSSSASEVAYAAGSNPSGLLFQSSKLGVDFANSIGENASTKIFPSSIIKVYVDDKYTASIQASNNLFSNVVAQLAGNPTNVQSALEKLAAENDIHDVQISNLQTKDVEHDTRLSQNRSVMGIAEGSTNAGSFTGTALEYLSNNSNFKALFQELAVSLHTVHEEIEGVLGIAHDEGDFGDGLVVLPDDSSAKVLMQAIDQELQNLYDGQGQFWDPVHAYVTTNIDLSNPGTATFNGATIDTGERVLVMGQSASSTNGIYVFNGTSTAMTRATDADEPADYSLFKTVQVLESTDEGISGATFAYDGIDNPTIGTNVLPFKIKSKGVVGDNSISEAKLTTTLAAKLNNKINRFFEKNITLVLDNADGNYKYTVNHGLDIEVPNVTIYQNGSITPYDVDPVDNFNLVISGSAADSNISIVVC